MQTINQPPVSDAVFTRRLARFAAFGPAPLLGRGLRGIEKESLRIDRQGRLADTPHPAALGAALTHPQITLDYSEALLELITPPSPTAMAARSHLDALHRFVYAELGDELLWAQSMPGPLPAENQIPIAYFGTSLVGQFKHVYRLGLALRYGRTMQCIAGIHYNFSFDEAAWQALREIDGAGASANAPDYQSAGYFSLIRNYRRYSWLLLYLFGASPAAHREFLGARAKGLPLLDADTVYLPYATSLRMSDLGYHNQVVQSAVPTSFDDLQSYVASVAAALARTHAPYEALGTHRDGKWVQLNGNVLQIENELYGTIRPKRVAQNGRPLTALATHGVQYIEARCLDIDPFDPVGIAASTAHFMDAFLIFCALHDSPGLDAAQHAEADANFLRSAREGRDPALMLARHGAPISLREWASELLDAVNAVAQVLDSEQSASLGTPFQAAVQLQRERVAHPETTPSARVLTALRQPGMSFTRFGLEMSARHAAEFAARPLGAAEQAGFEAQAAESIAAEAALARRDAETAAAIGEAAAFDAFLAAYYRSTSDPTSEPAGEPTNAPASKPKSAATLTQLP
ncbi:MAG: glutamate--cysteine ligase [Janthinobacterium lividum]